LEKIFEENVFGEENQCNKLAIFEVSQTEGEEENAQKLTLIVT
jgi:hypothetical protein